MMKHFLLLLFLASGLILSVSESKFGHLLPQAADQSFSVGYIQMKSAENCSYRVVISTSCSSPKFTTDEISIVFGDAYGNQVYAPKLGDPISRTFEQCSSDIFQIDGACAPKIGYVYLYRSGTSENDGWKPESLIIYGIDREPITFDFNNTSIPNDKWFGYNLSDFPTTPPPFDPFHPTTPPPFDPFHPTTPPPFDPFHPTTPPFHPFPPTTPPPHHPFPTAPPPPFDPFPPTTPPPPFHPFYPTTPPPPPFHPFPPTTPPPPPHHPFPPTTPSPPPPPFHPFPPTTPPPPPPHHPFPPITPPPPPPPHHPFPPTTPPPPPPHHPFPPTTPPPPPPPTTPPPPPPHHPTTPPPPPPPTTPPHPSSSYKLFTPKWLICVVLGFVLSFNV